jgi:adenosylcobinamide-phosphate synthase
MGVTATGAVALSLALDAVFEEFPGRIHPVALFGRLVGLFDREWARPGPVGALAALALPLVAGGVAAGLVLVATWVNPWFVGAVAGLVLFSTTSLRMLLSATRTVVEGADADPDGAREAATALVGRDTTDLSAAELRSTALESAAENLADGLVAPLLAFALGAQVSLAFGAGAAAWVKGVNTLDSMLGYREKPVGAVSARLDDLVMWLPARVSALLLALAAGSPTALSRAREWARDPDSPNSGWPMATLAAALDVRLRKREQYDLNPDAAFPTVATARHGGRVVAVAGVLAFLLAGVAVWF